MENTSANKKRFFAQHFGQKIIEFNVQNINTRDKKTPVFVDIVNLSYPMIEYSVLELKSVNLITNVDLLAISLNAYSPKLKDSTLIGLGTTTMLMYKQKGLSYMSIRDYQYLQSRGYALPWMGLSVEDLISYGWIKLIY